MARQAFGISFYIGKKSIRKISDVAFDKGMKDVLQRMKNLRPFFQKKVIPLMVKDAANSFDTMSGPDGGWAKLKDSSAKRKDWEFKTNLLTGPQRWPVSHGSNVIGKKTGLMSKALTSLKPGWGSIRRIEKDRMFFGVDRNKIPYALRFMRGYKTQPARRIQLLSYESRNTIRARFQIFVAEAIEKASRIYMRGAFVLKRYAR